MLLLISRSIYSNFSTFNVYFTFQSSTKESLKSSSFSLALFLFFSFCNKRAPTTTFASSLFKFCPYSTKSHGNWWFSPSWCTWRSPSSTLCTCTLWSSPCAMVLSSCWSNSHQYESSQSTIASSPEHSEFNVISHWYVSIENEMLGCCWDGSQYDCHSKGTSLLKSFSSTKVPCRIWWLQCSQSLVDKAICVCNFHSALLQSHQLSWFELPRVKITNHSAFVYTVNATLCSYYYSIINYRSACEIPKDLLNCMPMFFCWSREKSTDNTNCMSNFLCAYHNIHQTIHIWCIKNRLYFFSLLSFSNERSQLTEDKI